MARTTGAARRNNENPSPNAAELHGDGWLESFIPYQLYKATNGLGRLLRQRLRKSGINLTRWRVLSVLKAYGPLSIGQIAAATAMEQPTLSRVVDQLASEKLVARRTSQTDSRFVHASLTPAGEEAFHAIAPAAQQHEHRALRGFTQAEIRTLRGLLHRLQQNIDED
ncbi:MAG: MarR family winged helix-turn-helix transcriptional regulator [Steroidobacteraceae bacterium]